MTEAEVWIQIDGDDVRAGILFSFGSGRSEVARFQYEPSYLANPAAYQLDPALPLRLGPYETELDVPMFSAFADAAPDRWGRRLMQRASDDDLTEFDYLMQVSDRMRQGALRFRRPTSQAFEAQGSRATQPQLELATLLNAARAVDDEPGNADALELLLHVGSSIGGARPKATVYDDRDHPWIAKFPRSSDEWDVGSWEHVAMLLAERAGITVPPYQLVDVDGSKVVLLSRFDRSERGRIGYVSAMTMLEARDGESHNYLEIADVIEEVGASTTRDLHQLFRRIAFMVMISNTDDHLRNHGFLWDSSHRGWELSPVFDLNPNPLPRRLQLTTAIDDSTNEANIEVLRSTAGAYRLKPQEADDVIHEVTNSVAKWREVAASVGLSKREVDQMESAFRL